MPAYRERVSDVRGQALADLLCAPHHDLALPHMLHPSRRVPYSDPVIIPCKHRSCVHYACRLATDTPLPDACPLLRTQQVATRRLVGKPRVRPYLRRVVFFAAFFLVVFLAAFLVAFLATFFTVFFFAGFFATFFLVVFFAAFFTGFFAAFFTVFFTAFFAGLRLATVFFFAGIGKNVFYV